MNNIQAHKGKRPMAPSVRLFLMFFYTHFAEQNLTSIVHAPTDENHTVKAAEAMPNLAQQSYDYALLSLAAASA